MENILLWSGFEFAIKDFVQILSIFFILYELGKNIYKTRSWVLIKGFLVIWLIYLSLIIFQLNVLQYIFEKLFSVAVIAMVIMLQPSIQKLVEKIGTKNAKDILKKNNSFSENEISEIIQAVEKMSEDKTGALIVIERKTPLNEYVETGIKLNSDISKELLINIFEKNTPLHDGAIIIRNNKIISATCYLPLSNNPSIPKLLGTRHRAAIGISELTDSVVVVVSEETGAISLVSEGKIRYKISRSELFNLLNENNLKQKNSSINPMNFIVKLSILLCSFFIWASIIVISDPIENKTYYNIPVNIKNSQILTDQNKMFHIVEGQNINIEVKARRSVLNNLTNTDIDVYTDLEELSIVYSMPVHVDVRKDVTVKNASSEVVKIELEDISQKEVNVEVVTKGDLSNEIYLFKKESDVKSVVLSGPKSIISTVDKAKVIIDITNINNNQTITSNIKVFDKNGSEITDNIELNKTVSSVNLEFLPIEKIPLKVVSNDNHKRISLVDEIYISIASEKTLKEVIVEIDPDDIKNKNETFTIDINKYLPDYVYLAGDSFVELSLEVE